MPVKNRKSIFTSLSLSNASKLDALAGKSGKPKTRVLDDAVEALYQKEESVVKEDCTVITIATNKGGAGKTTSTAAIGDILARRGYSILLIDADPQGNLSKRFGYAPNGSSENYLGNLIRDRMDKDCEHKDISYYINHSAENPRIDIIVSDLRLDGVYGYMNGKGALGTMVIKKIMSEVKALGRYRYILVDTRPSLNNEVAAVLIATDYVLIPVEPTEDAILGADSTISFAASCREINPGLRTLGVFMTKVYDRNKSFREAAPVIRESWQGSVFKTLIPRSQDADNAGNEGKPVTTMFSNKKLAKRYEQLVEEALQRIEEMQKEG